MTRLIVIFSHFQVYPQRNHMLCGSILQRRGGGMRGKRAEEEVEEEGEEVEEEGVV